MPKAKYQSLGAVHDVRDFLSRVLEKRGSPDDLWVFRGQFNAAWDPSPQIDRVEFVAYRAQVKIKWTRDHHERWLLEEFKKGARPHALVQPQDQWEWLALAQHYGLATRLLDWTTNPLGALYFAVERADVTTDSVVWCYHHRGPMAVPGSDPFQVAAITAYWPPHVTQRITVQGGCFTAHAAAKPNVAVTWPGDLLQVIVPGPERRRLRLELGQIGITRSTLFPDLDGIAVGTNRRASLDSPTQAVVKRPRGG